MHICLYTDSDVFAGTERHILDLARALTELGEQVTIAAPASANPHSLAQRVKVFSTIHFLPIPKQGHIDQNAITTLAALLQNKQLDLIHAHNGRTHIAAARAVQKAGRGVCIATQHFLAPARTQRRGLKAFLANRLHKQAEKYTAHTIAISHAVRQAALDRHDTAPEKITTVHNGIYPPTHAETPQPSSPGIAIPGPTPSPTNPTIFCAARLEAEKDLDLLIEAMAIVQKQIPSARCLIAGEGRLQQQLQTQIDQLHLHNAVTLLGFTPNVSRLLQAADLFILPARAEPFGLVVLEAMAAAKPVITANTGGPAEIIDPASGLAVPPTAKHFANAILQLLNNPDQRHQLAQGALQRFQQNFTAQRMAQEIVGIYKRFAPQDRILQQDIEMESMPNDGNPKKTLDYSTPGIAEKSLAWHICETIAPVTAVLLLFTLILVGASLSPKSERRNRIILMMPIVIGNFVVSAGIICSIRLWSQGRRVSWRTVAANVLLCLPYLFLDFMLIMDNFHR